MKRHASSTWTLALGIFAITCTTVVPGAVQAQAAAPKEKDKEKDAAKDKDAEKDKAKKDD